jgi:hypothetical protein
MHQVVEPVHQALTSKFFEDKSLEKPVKEWMKIMWTSVLGYVSMLHLSIHHRLTFNFKMKEDAQQILNT